MVIDAHVHLYPVEINRDPAAWAAAAGEERWGQLCTRRRKSGRAVQRFPSVDELLREMDRAGVARAVLLGWYWETADACAGQNRFYAECVRAHADRLAAFGTVQPRAGRTGAVEELKRAREAGLVGLGELSPHSQGYAIDDPVFCDVLACAAEWRWPVNLHVTDPNSRDYPGRVETPLEDFGRLARVFPRVNFVLAHWGGLLPLRDAAAAKLENLYFDTAASPLVYDDTVWARFAAVVPTERVLFGSDYPLNLFPKLEAEPEVGRLLAEARRAGAGADVLGGNARRLIGR